MEEFTGVIEERDFSTMENLTELYTVPSSILIEFFRKTVEKLDRYACGNEYCSETGEVQAVADSLAVLRMRLIQVQLETLHQIVEDYNSRSAKDSLISIESVQVALRQVGKSRMDGEGCNDGGECLYESMQRMNEAARLAFVRSVINAYQEEIEQKVFGKRQENEEAEGDPLISSSISRQEMLEYFGLVIVALSMDDVQRYLANGGQIDFSGNSSSLQQQADEHSSPETRLLVLQDLFLRAVKGRSITENPTVFILREAKRLLLTETTTSSSNDDQERSKDDDGEEFLRVFENYLSAVRVARENAISTSSLSDLDHDGVTRVVSVTYSEISPMDAGEATSPMSLPPRQSVMDEYRESEQRKNLSMARKASEMQQTLMDQLLVMDEDDRALVLREAKEAHDNFLKEALSIPPGPQRILFMQSIEEENQKKLIMHRLWESKMQNNEEKSLHYS